MLNTIADRPSPARSPLFGDPVKAEGLADVPELCPAPPPSVAVADDVSAAELYTRLSVATGIKVPLGAGNSEVVWHGCSESGQVPSRSRSLSRGPVGPVDR